PPRCAPCSPCSPWRRVWGQKRLGASCTTWAGDFIRGNEVPHMSAVYRETISDERLKAVTAHFHTWLSPPPKKDKPNPREDGAAESGEEEEKERKWNGGEKQTPRS